MFKIKTKKDKEIKELQKDIDRLKRMLEPTTFTIEKKSNINTFTSEFVVPIEAINSVSEKTIKRVLASKMLEVVEENLEIEANDDMLRNFKVYRAELRVVKKMR